MMTDWRPDYPTEASRAYLRGFVAGTESERLGEIPDNTLSAAITIAIGAQWPALKAGKCFAAMYWRILKRKPPRGGYDNWHGYLIASYEKELQDLGKL